MPALTVSRRGLLGFGAAAVVAACTGRSARRAPVPGVRAQRPSLGGRKPLTIGCIAPFTGPRAAVGDRVQSSLAAAVAHIDHDLDGSYDGYRPRIVRADAPLTGADGQKAYAELLSQKVDAILWCGSPGLEESIPDIVRDLMPVIAVGTDLQSRAPFNPRVPDMTTLAASGSPIFQTAVPDTAAVDLLLEYARIDRAFESAALLFSITTHPNMDVYFDAACKRLAMRNAGMVGYDGAGGNPDMGPPVASLRGTGAQVVVILAPANEAGATVAALDAMGSRYADASVARGPGFHPMVLGGPRSVGDAIFARSAAGHAPVGAVSVGAIGEFAGLPRFPLRDWASRLASSPERRVLAGGEQGPADGLAAIVTAAARAASTDGADLVAALESGVQISFASSVPFHFGADRHLAVTAGDLTLTTLEVPPGGPYNLGREWSEGFLPPGFVGPDLLLDFTFDRNRRAHPQVMDEILAARVGTSCRPEYQGGDPGKIAACRAVH
ncbi:MAG: hypothetical protein NVS3B21_12150 [Acidimicrobiales bacterium]